MGLAHAVDRARAPVRDVVLLEHSEVPDRVADLDPAAGELVERRGLLGDDRRVLQDHVGDVRRQLDPLRAPRRRGEDAPDVLVVRLVRTADAVEAELVRELDRLDQLVGGVVGQHRVAEAHRGVLLRRRWVCGRAGRRRGRATRGARAAREVEAALAGDVGVGVERDVGDRVAIGRPGRGGRSDAPPSRRERACRRAWRSASAVSSHRLRQESQKRATATFGSWSYCSKNSHCSTCARSYRVGREIRRAVARYQRIAFDSARQRPSSSSSTGTRRAGFLPPSTSLRFERSTTSSSRRSYASPSWASRSRTL